MMKTGSADPIADATLQALGQEDPDPGFIPRYMSRDSELFQAIYDRTDILEIGLDLSQSPFDAIADNPLTGIVYALLVVGLGALYFGQQRMVAARASISPTMSATQQKVMQYLPVVFAVFQLFFLTALVIYYIFQTLLRILQQFYITRRFYGHDEALGRQAQRASEAAREEAKKSGDDTGFFGQMKRELGDAAGAGRDAPDSRPGGAKGGATGGQKSGGQKSGGQKSGAKKSTRPTTSKRVTPPKNRPVSSRAGGSPSGGGKGRPTPSQKNARGAKNRPSPNKKRKKK